MPIIKSAKKRVKVSAKARARNLGTKRQLRDALKAYAKALEDGKPAEVSRAKTAAISALDIAVKKAIIHKNKAARFKSRMSTQAKSAGIKPAKVAKTPAKAVKTPKKPAKTAKSSAKKTAAKKPTPKK